MTPPQTDWGELDGGPLTDRERRKLRAIIEEHDREEWARRRIRVLVPWAVGIISAGWALVEWLGKYVSWKGGPQ